MSEGGERPFIARGFRGRLLPDDRQGFWAQLGYHDRGEPWREQRYQGDP